jgi:hypothetical protein
MNLSTKPAYWRDTRLQREVVFGGRPVRPAVLRLLDGEAASVQSGSFETVRVVGCRVVSGKTLCENLRNQTGVSLFLQADWRTEFVALPVRPGRACELMDALAAAFAGRWLRVGDGWILSRSEEEAELTLMPEEQRLPLVGQNLRQAALSLTPDQWQRLAPEGGRLFLGDLPEGQRSSLLAVLRLLYYSPDQIPTARPTLQALAGQGSGWNSGGRERR